MGVFASFIGGYGKSQSPKANCSTLQNQYVEALEPGSKSQGALYPTPGMERFGAVTQIGGKRAFSTAASSSRMFSVTGMKLYEWFADGSALERGTVAIDANPAVLFTNGDGGQQLGVCAGGNFYVLDLQTNVFTQVAFLDGKATQGGFAGGYFLVFDINTGTVYQSDLFDGLTFDPLNFFQRSVQADNWNGFYVASWGQLFLPGTKTRDYYYNAGTFPIPFAPAQSGIQTEGIAATFSVVECGTRLAWLSTAGQGGYKVLAASGYQAEEISNEPICFALSRFSQSEIARAQAESYSDQGHDFYLLTVGDTTFCFDFKTGVWHTRRSFVNVASGEQGAWRARWHCFAFNKHLWLDADTGVVYESDIEFPSDVDDLPIQRQRTTPSINELNQVLDIGEIELIMQTGIGNQNDPFANPMIGLEISRDGGFTWGRQRFVPAGRIGQTFLRVRWQLNGSGRDVAFRFTMTDSVVNWRMMAMLVKIRGERGDEIDLARAA